MYVQYLHEHDLHFMQINWTGNQARSYTCSLFVALMLQVRCISLAQGKKRDHWNSDCMVAEQSNWVSIFTNWCNGTSGSLLSNQKIRSGKIFSCFFSKFYSQIILLVGQKLVLFLGSDYISMTAAPAYLFDCLLCIIAIFCVHIFIAIKFNYSILVHSCSKYYILITGDK